MEKMIKKAHDAITRIKGKEYAPTSNEIQEWIDNQPLKLYTEEQLLKFFETSYFIMEKDLENCKPIELPNDEEIEKESDNIAHNYFDMHNTNHYQGLKEGAEKMGKWMIEQFQKKIQKQLIIEIMKTDEKDGLYE